ncbi:LysE family translocator [Photobacterium sp. J15]|uniref:LysE family translocator n=1 Tax=Photobacterium sp. J15 TaxID=265901 RepID=UPI000A02A369|nr:LysE family translocator [Photobacterium sp. J15]
MINLALLSVFVPTFFFVSVTPGMCMTLALSLGMSIGYRRTLWMMLGEVIGVAIVAIAAVLGISALMLNSPWLFIALKILGAGYLFYLGVQLWLSRGKLALSQDQTETKVGGNWELTMQGFVTAIANPKGWAFMVSLLPPFIEGDKPVFSQLFVLVGIIMISEFVSMTMYATGGKGVKRLLKQTKNVRLINRVSGTLMMGVSVWLLFS